MAELLFTFGLAYEIEEIVHLIWGRAPVDYRIPESLNFTLFTLFNTQYPAYRAFMMLVSVGMLAGGTIKKSRVISQWPGLAERDLFEQRDLVSTIDYRSVCAACIENALGLDHDLIAEKVFFTPGLPRVYDYIFS